jgi:hypothetical protein
MISAFVVLGAGPARAQFGFKVNLPGSDTALKDADAQFRKGLDALPNSYGSDPEAEAKGLSDAEGYLKGGNEKLTGTAKMADGFKDVDARRQQLEAGIAQGKLMLACSQARGVIRKTHETGAEAPADQLKALDDVVAAFAGAARPEFKDSLRWWQEEAKRVRENNASYAQSAKAEAQRRAHAKLSKMLREVEGAADKMVKELREKMTKGEEAIPEDKLSAFASEIEKIKAAHAPAALYYQRELTDYRYYNAWFKPDAEAAKALAEVLGAEVVTTGESKAKRVDAAFAAKADSCYLVATRWKTYTDQEKMDNSDFASKGGLGALQEWGFWRGGRWGRMMGVCATADRAVTWGADLTFAGTQNGVRFVVLSWARDKFPIYLGSYLSLWVRDMCDTEAWKNLWLKPVPGTLVWGEKEPYLLAGNDGVDSVWVTGWNLTGGQPRMQKNGLSGQAPAKRTVATQFNFPKCSTDRATDPEAVKLAQCHAAIDKKYGPQFDKWNETKEYAKTVAEYQTAKQKLDQLSAADEKERAQKCDPIEEKIRKRWEATFNGLVDEFNGKGPADRLDTPAQWASEAESYYD